MTGHQEAKDREMTGQHEVPGQGVKGLKEDQVQKEPGLIGRVLPEEGQIVFSDGKVKDRGRDPHLETDPKAEVVSGGIMTAIMVNHGTLVGAGLEEKADPDSRGLKTNGLKEAEEMKADRKRLFFRKTDVHPRVSC